MTDVGTGALALQATTGAGGYTLIAGTGDVITWQPPSDGGLHRVLVVTTLSITSNETGGALIVTGTAPDATAISTTISAGGVAASRVVTWTAMLVQAGTKVAVHQNSSLSGGAAVLWAEIYGS